MERKKNHPERARKTPDTQRKPYRDEVEGRARTYRAPAAPSPWKSRNREMLIALLHERSGIHRTIIRVVSHHVLDFLFGLGDEELSGFGSTAEAEEGQHAAAVGIDGIGAVEVAMPNGTLDVNRVVYVHASCSIRCGGSVEDNETGSGKRSIVTGDRTKNEARVGIYLGKTFSRIGIGSLDRGVAKAAGCAGLAGAKIREQQNPGSQQSSEGKRGPDFFHLHDLLLLGQK